MNWINSALILLAIVILSNALYEHQVDRFDWHLKLIGRVKYLKSFILDGSEYLAASTYSNILALLNATNGEIVWRKQYENGADISAMHVINHQKHLLVTISSINSMLRVFHLKSGFMYSEHILDLSLHDCRTHLVSMESSDVFSLFAFSSTNSFAVSINFTNGISMDVLYNISTNWFNEDVKCAINSPDAATAGFFTVLCIDRHNNAMNVFTKNDSFTNTDLTHSELGRVFENSNLSTDFRVFGVQGNRFLLHVDGFIVMLEVDTHGHISHSFVYSGQFSAICSSMSSEIFGDFNRVVIIQDNMKSFSIIDPSNTDSSSLYSYHLDIDSHAQISDCTGFLYDDLISLILINTKDSLFRFDSVDGNITWIRNEGLANIISVQTADLPLDNIDLTLEKDFAHVNFLNIFFYRVKWQILQLFSWIGSFRSRLDVEKSDLKSVFHLKRDLFNLNKIIIAITESGQMFGMNSESAQIIWSSNEVFNSSNIDQSRLKLFTIVYDKSCYCSLALIVTESFLVLLDPLLGLVRHTHRFESNILQAFSLPSFDSHSYYDYDIILVNETHAMFWPPSSNRHRPDIYVYRATDANITGYTISPSMKLHPVWQITYATPVSSTAGSEQHPPATVDDDESVVRARAETYSTRIRHVQRRLPAERVHSQGIVLSDRSVLYKYLNPNLLAVIVEKVATSTLKSYVSLYLIDAVTGHVLHSHTHARAVCPCHVVFSENWLVYTVSQQRVRRTELYSIQLFEGNIRHNSTFFSSFSHNQLPQVETQGYIFPESIALLSSTRTTLGLTNRHILVALPSGRVIGLDRAILVAQKLSDDMPTYPYVPELRIPDQATLNYNKTLFGIRSIHTSTSGLESTCLMLVYGTDMFWTSVLPSKMFDQLQEDFDRSFLVLVIVSLALAVFITRKLSHMKALKQTWK